MDAAAQALSTNGVTSFTLVDIQETKFNLPSSIHHNNSKSKNNESSKPMEGVVEGEPQSSSLCPKLISL